MNDTEYTRMDKIRETVKVAAFYNICRTGEKIDKGWKLAKENPAIPTLAISIPAGLSLAALLISDDKVHPTSLYAKMFH